MAKKKILGGAGITMPGYTSGMTASPGVTLSGTTYSFAGNVVDYIRIPYANTPSPVAENVQVTIRFIVNSINGTRLDLLSRYMQGNDAPSWIISVNASRAIEYIYNNISLTTTGAISAFGVEQDLIYKRVNGVYTISINGLQCFSMNYPGTFTNTWDWVLGSYLNSTGGVIASTYAFPCNWQLLELTVARI